jgi:hypothetical protein
MVDTAKAETAQAEKLLREANGKIDVLQAEVKALKELVLTSTPSTPNKHLYPHLNITTTNTNSNNNISNHNKNGHSRQSSLNQLQTLNLVNNNNNNNNPTATSTPSTTSFYNNSNGTHLSANTSLNKSDTKLSTSQSSFNLLNTYNNNNNNNGNNNNVIIKEKKSLFTKSHKRAPSQNDIQNQTKSFIDKIFNQQTITTTTNQQQPMNDSLRINDTISDNSCQIAEV